MQYESGDDVDEGNVESFEEKVVLKIRTQGPSTVSYTHLTLPTKRIV